MCETARKQRAGSPSVGRFRRNRHRIELSRGARIASEVSYIHTGELRSPAADFGEIGPHEIGIVPHPHNVASLLQQVFVDVVTQTSSLERSGFDFVPAGTRDNSPALQCWDDGCSDPFESRQGRKRSDHCLSSLTGLCDLFCLVPSTEVLGYFQSVPHGTQAPLGLKTIVSSIEIKGSK